MSLLHYIVPFLLALGVLVVVHEFGHYAVARACGVKILRFSIGFGRALWMRRFGRDRTEWAIAVVPLGGYVKMLDEREAPVAAEELGRAFNRQGVGKRMLIVAAGPVANFVLAVLCYWVLYVHGVEEIRPVLGAPVAGSAAAKAGFREGETALRVDDADVATWQELRWQILRHSLKRTAAAIEVKDAAGSRTVRRLDFSAAGGEDLDSDPLHRLGFRLYRPRLPAVIGKVAGGGAAERAGLQPGDRIARIDGKRIESWADLVAAIRPAAGRMLELDVERGGGSLLVRLKVDEAQENGRRIGRIGIAVREDATRHPELTTVIAYDPLRALGKAVRQTWDTITFSVSVLGRMVTGEVSWKNLSGPVTIADYAGQSARLGIESYLKFLALISISLGVLNLLPIPILDGGHLMYYTVELVKGGPVSERAMEIGQQIGLALLLMLMVFAFYNDINRLVSG
ncbi:MAG: RIP metalloprotease RseP [Rhodocyclaceae bacterium]